MSSLVEHLIRKLQSHSERFSDLPLVVVPSAAVSDQDTAAWSRESYERDVHEDRKARGLLLLTLFGALIAAAILSTGVARADGVVSDVEAQYILANADAVCATIDKYPTKAGVLGVMQGVIDHGFSASDSVDVINASVYAWCPRHWPLLERIGA